MLPEPTTEEREQVSHLHQKLDNAGSSDGLVAHECILDLRPLKDTSGVEVEAFSEPNVA